MSVDAEFGDLAQRLMQALYSRFASEGGVMRLSFSTCGKTVTVPIVASDVLDHDMCVSAAKAVAQFAEGGCAVAVGPLTVKEIVSSGNRPDDRPHPTDSADAPTGGRAQPSMPDADPVTGIRANF